jgi:hypothetical protein
MARSVVIYRRFGTTYQSHLQALSSLRTAWPLKMGLIGCPETSVNNYQSTLCNIPKEWRSHVCLIKKYIWTNVNGLPEPCNQVPWQNNYEEYISGHRYSLVDKWAGVKYYCRGKCASLSHGINLSIAVVLAQVPQLYCSPTCICNFPMVTRQEGSGAGNMVSFDTHWLNVV